MKQPLMSATAGYDPYGTDSEPFRSILDGKQVLLEVQADRIVVKKPSSKT